jgi:hypothetical protein
MIVPDSMVPAIEEIITTPELMKENEIVPDLFDPEEVVAFMFFEAGEIIIKLGTESFNNEESAIELKIEMDFIFSLFDDGMCFESLILLENDILQRMDGCANIGQPDEDD